MNLVTLLVEQNNELTKQLTSAIAQRQAVIDENCKLKNGLKECEAMQHKLMNERFFELQTKLSDLER